MKKSIIINSKEYEIPEIKFATLRAMERAGVDFVNGAKEPFNYCFQVFKFFSGLDEETADKEIEEHFENGGSLDSIAELTNDVNNFFTKTKKHKN